MKEKDAVKDIQQIMCGFWDKTACSTRSVDGNGGPLTFASEVYKTVRFDAIILKIH